MLVRESASPQLGDDGVMRSSFVYRCISRTPDTVIESEEGVMVSELRDNAHESWPLGCYSPSINGAHQPTRCVIVMIDLQVQVQVLKIELRSHTPAPSAYSID